MKYIKLILLVFSLLLLPWAGNEAWAKDAEITDLRWTARNDGDPPFVRIVTDLTKAVQAEAAIDKSGKNFEVILKNTQKSFSGSQYDMDPRAIDFELLVDHLKELKAGNVVNQPVYSFVTHNRTDDTVATHPRKVMIVEGILILANPELRDLFDVKIFVHADSDERLIRRLKRDIAERGRDMAEVLNRYQTTLKPMHQQFIEPTKAFADIIIPNDKYNTVAIDVVRAVINQRLT